MKTFSRLKKNLNNDRSHLQALKIALLGDTATQFLNIALAGEGFERGYDLQIWEAEFNQVEREVFDPDSDLYAFQPEIIIIFLSSHKLLAKYNKLNSTIYSTLADQEISLISSIATALNEKLKAKLIFYNYPEINDSVFGNFANKTPSSFQFQLRKLNYLLMSYAAGAPGFFLCDLSSIQNQYGKANVFQPSVYVTAEMVLSIDILPEVAAKTVDMISATAGQFKKCLIFDLDNTLWGGIIGDDGMDRIQIGSLGIGKAFTEFQYWIKKLKNRGIILAVCSKNTDSIAREPFKKHPDMVLHMDDISVFVANWENKADNIRYIKEVLNIGYDSMVFLDDNPFERSLVRENIPDICIPELPEDPAEYLEYLYTLNLFETASFSEADAARTEQYQLQAERVANQQSFTNEEEFLASLNMVSVVEPFNSFNVPRVAQLSQRSNQFNVRTVRYTDNDVEMMIDSAEYFTFSFTLADKFGDNGLISIIVLKKKSAEILFIDNWLMSCRVLKRGMEAFALNTIAGFALKAGYSYLEGEYLPTAKNGMVKEHYKSLGFEAKEHRWVLNLNFYKMRPCLITKKITKNG